jgi:hypothetical protein
MRNRWLSLLFFSCLISCSAICEAGRLRIIGMEFPPSVQKNKQGALDFMLTDFLADIDDIVVYEITNAARAYRMFTNMQAHCLMPSSAHQPYFGELEVTHSKSFTTANFTAFSSDGTLIETKQQLSNKIVGMIRDDNAWDYQERLDFNAIKFVGVRNLESLVKMLYKNRIDIAIHDKGDFLDYLRTTSLPLPTFSETNPMWSDKIVISCHKSQTNDDFINKVNPLIEALNNSGRLGYYYQKAVQLNN